MPSTRLSPPHTFVYVCATAGKPRGNNKIKKGLFVKSTSAVVVAAVALAADMFIYGMAIPVIPRIVAAQGASDAAIGVLFAVYAAALLIATPIVGKLIDKVGTRMPMLIGLLGLAASTVMFAFAQSFPGLLVARSLQGVAAAVSFTSGFALIASVYPAAERGKPMGIAMSAMGFGILLGPFAGGFLADQFGTRAPFYFAAAIVALDAIARVTLLKDVPHVPREAPSRVWRHPAMPLLFLLTAMGAGLIAFLEPVLPMHVTREFSASATAIGVIFGVAALIGASVAPMTGAIADKVPRTLLVLTGAVVAAAGMITTSLAGSLFLTGVGVTLTAIGGQIVLIPTLTLIGQVADSSSPPAYGASYSAYSIAYTAGLLVAPLAAGFSTTGAGFRTAMVIGAALACALGIASFAFRRSMTSSTITS